MPLAYHTNTLFQNCAFCYILLACIVSQPSPTRAAALDTGTPGHAQTAPERTKRQPQKRHTDERTRRQHQRQSRPRDQAQKRNARRARASTTAAAETRPPADTQPTRAAEIEPEPESQKRGTVDHERRRRQREGKERKEERERRENDSKTLLFSPSHRTPSRSTARASPAPTDTDSSRNAAFFGSAFVEYAESTEINASFDHTEGGDGSYFHNLTNAKNLALYPLLHASIFFTEPSSHKHTVHQRYISLQI